MQNLFVTHKKTAWSLSIVGVLLIALVVTLALLNWNLLRPTIARAITAKTGRPAFIDGDLIVHVFSWTPNAAINGLRILNPPWADRQVMFGAKRIFVSVSLGRLLGGQLVIPQVEVDSPVINLQRDLKGRASWELGTKTGTPNGDTSPTKLPAIRSIVVKDGAVHVVDAVRKLRFAGSVVISDKAGSTDRSALQVRTTGTLNEKPFTLNVNGGPLLDISPKTPYTVNASVTAADIKLDTEVTVQKPFDMGLLDVKFAVSGKDLADVFYLTGLALPNTPPYRFAASVHVSGTTYQIDDLDGRLGTSDISGKVTVEAASKRPKFSATLKSKNLNMADLAPTLGTDVGKKDTLATHELAPGPGKKPVTAAVKPSPPNPSAPKTETAEEKAHDKLLPDSQLEVKRVRGMDADVTFHAEAVTLPKVPMKGLSLHVILDDGVLTIDPLAFELEQGRFAGVIRLDARGAIPDSSIDMTIRGVDLGQFKAAGLKDPPLKGTLTGRIKLQGKGDSIHAFASDADGAMSIIIPHGEIDESFAELTSINITRGLGLFLTKNETKADIRCSVIDFQTQNGAMGIKTFFVDTSDVLITAKGGVNLNTEALDMELQGDPKKIRFTRVRSPITLGGTLAHPAAGLNVKKLAGQAAVAAALGTLLTPAAAILAFVDPGLTKDKDCSASLSEEAPAQAGRIH